MLPPRCLTPFSHTPCARQNRDSSRNCIRGRADMLTKIKVTLLLKWLAVFCGLDNIGAEVGSVGSRGIPPTSLFPADELLYSLLSRTAKLEAAV
eukprot:scaffold50786_cov63-Phaeocystis_antarctica.AAC.1